MRFHIMQQVAEDLYDISAAEPVFQEELARSLQKTSCDPETGMGHGQGRRVQTDFSDHARQRTVCCCIRNLLILSGYANAQ